MVRFRLAAAAAFLILFLFLDCCFSLAIDDGPGFKLRVPKILAFLIPEILSDLVLAGRSSLLPPLLGKREGRREEDAGNAETPRNRNLA